MDQLVTIGGVQHFLSKDRLRICQAGDPVLDVSLSPVFDGKTVPIREWKPGHEGGFAASLGRYGTAFLRESMGRLAYWIETPAKQFERVTYLSDGVISGDSWRTFVSDDYERLWDKRIDAKVPISSAYAAIYSPDGNSEGGMTDPADIPVHWIWNVHVRAFALDGAKRWLGVSIPGPWGIGVTRLAMESTRFNLRFEVIRPSCTGGKMPVLYFCPDLASDSDVLDEHRTLSERLGLVNLEPKEIPQWWVNPWYGYYDELERQQKAGTITLESSNVIDLLAGWLAQVQKDCDHRTFNVNMEQGCYRIYGDYRPSEVMGTEAQIRARVDAWRTEGIHVGHYIHPFLVNTKVDFYKEHPEAFCKPKDPRFLMEYACEPWDPNPAYAPIDWTHPLGREFILKWVDYMISDAPGCLNCDILRSNHWRSPDPRVYDFHDPDWGIGDMMTYRAQKMLYERVKSIKPHAMVSKLAMLDPYMQPTFDAMQMCEDWTHNMQYWYRRTQLATRMLKNTLIWVDPWFCTRTKWSEFFMSMMAVIIPETQAVTHTTHPYYPSWRKLEERHLHRRKSGIHVYLNSPPHPSDDSRLAWTYDSLEVRRLKTSGPLAGWYGALALSPQCVVSYSESQAVVASSEDRLDWVSLPPGAELTGVTRVFHDGREEAYEYLRDPAANRIQIKIEDCGREVFYYRITYVLDKPG